MKQWTYLTEVSGRGSTKNENQLFYLLKEILELLKSIKSLSL